MKRVYLIRHCQPLFPEGKRLCLGKTELPLSESGLAQARAMAARIPAVTAVFSSPQQRALQTAQAMGKPVTVLPGLRELDYGAWDGLSFDRIRRLYPGLYAARGEDPTLMPPESEDPKEALVRFQSAMEQAAEAAPGDFAVVAHGGIIAEFLNALTGIRQKPGYGQVIALLWQKDGGYGADNSFISENPR